MHGMVDGVEELFLVEDLFTVTSKENKVVLEL